ncbi:MAG TPA: hypothetical protein VMM18_03905 [Gemmatimonadaceae bacterium]|nr:hypothetical protein [Gemmatimonadaceae bacterium]
MAPPAEYAAWWAVTSACAGIDGDFDAVSWFVVPSSQSIEYRGNEYQGLWYSRGNRIVLADNSVQNGPLVRHEMLHALTGGARHSAEYFRARCGGVVVCEGECAREVGPSPAPLAGLSRLSPAQLRLAVEVVTTPGWANAEGWVGVLVSVTNPHDAPRLVQLSPFEPRAPIAQTFGYTLAGPDAFTSGAVYEYGRDTLVAFAAGETRRRLFDLRLPLQGREVRGLYNGGVSDPVSVSLER